MIFDRITSLFTGKYYCPECGGKMEFEDDDEEYLVCEDCGFSQELDHYGYDDDEYAELYPLEDEEYEFDEDESETYEEVYGELSNRLED